MRDNGNKREKGEDRMFFYFVLFLFDFALTAMRCR
jgi:hypothetical protein